MSQQLDLWGSDEGTLADQRTPPFFWFPNDLVDSGALRDMTPADALVLIVLTRYVNYRTNTTWPSINRIADHADLAPKTVRASLRRLIDLGHLAIVRRGGPGVGSNEYALTLPDGRKREAAPPQPKNNTRGTNKSSGESHHQSLVRYFCAKWEAAYGAKYPFQRGKDGDAMRAILDHDGDVRRAAAAIDAFFADTDPFVVDAKHPLAIMRSRLNRYVATKGGPRTARPEDDFNGAPLTDAERELLWGSDDDADDAADGEDGDPAGAAEGVDDGE